MNNQLKDFINGIGAMTEIWTMVYNNFIKQGYKPQDALVHTREFTAAMMISMVNQNGNKEGEENGSTGN